MNKKLYVGNLSYSMTDADLQRLFERFGPVVSAAIIKDNATGRSKGFGFVEMESEKAAQDAIAQLNDTEVNERTITVNEARPPKERSFGGGGRGGSRGGGGGRFDRRDDNRGGNRFDRRDDSRDRGRSSRDGDRRRY